MMTTSKPNFSISSTDQLSLLAIFRPTLDSFRFLGSKVLPLMIANVLPMIGEINPIGSNIELTMLSMPLLVSGMFLLTTLKVNMSELGS